MMGLLYTKLGGNFHGSPEDILDDNNGISEGARNLLDDVFDGLDCTKIIDYHTHVAGRGSDGEGITGCYLHPSMQTGYNFLQRIKARIFLSASGCEWTDTDSQFIDRLRHLVEHSCRYPSEPRERPFRHGRNLLLAFDQVYGADGHIHEDQSSLYVPNNYVTHVADTHPDHFVAACSVHPFRSDAMDELERCAKHGIRIIKWLPNVMGFSPDDERCDKFYDTVKRLDMTILCHVGDEHSLTAGVLDNSNGNPLLLRRALDKGVKVIMAHCATEGSYKHPEHGGTVSGFEIFLWMMRREEYKDVLFGDISAISAFKRAKHIKALLQSDDIHSRLVYGSDYPVPAIFVVTSTKLLYFYGLLTWQQCLHLNEIYSYNPLLYDIALKRTVKCPETGNMFPLEVFQEHQSLPVKSVSSEV